MKPSPILFLTLLLAPALSHAMNGAGETSGLSLLMPLGARPVAMGEAYSAVASGADSLLWNPAGLNQLRDWQLGVGHLSYVQGVSDDLIQVAKPLYGLGAIGFGATYLSSGPQQFYDVYGNNYDTNTGAPLGSFSTDEFSAQLGMALQLNDDLAVGLTYKILRQEYSQDAMGSAFDVGVQWLDLWGKRLDLGFVAQNLGTPIALGSTFYNLQMAFRLGAAMHPVDGMTLALEEDFRPWNSPGSTLFNQSINLVHVGGEYVVPVGEWQAAVRAGYVLGPAQDLGTLGGFSVGGGLTMGAWQVDYAWAPMGDLGQSHRLSLTYSLGDN